MRRLLKLTGALLAAVVCGAVAGIGVPFGPYQDSAGWTVFTPSLGTGTCGDSSGTYTGTCIVYVSSSGNDGTCTSFTPPATNSPSNTCATFSAAFSKFRQGMPDWILVERGGTLVPTSQVIVSNARIGRSKFEPTVISGYGATTARWGVDLRSYNASSALLQVQSGSGTTVYMAVNDCYVTNSAKDPASGNYSLTGFPNTGGFLLSLIFRGSYLHMENCQFYYAGGLSAAGSGSAASPAMLGELIYRRNSQRNNYAVSNDGTDNPLPTTLYSPRTGTNGVLAYGYERLLVEENLFYQPTNMFSQNAAATVTITIASPAVVTWTSAGLPPAGIPPEGSVVAFTTTGSLPTGIVDVTGQTCFNVQCYYLRNVNLGAKTANISRWKTNSFTGSISGTTLTVTGFVEGGGRISPGLTLSGSGVIGGTTIVSGSGTDGTYQVSVSQTVSSTTMSALGDLVTTTGSQSGTHSASWADPQADIYIHNLYIDLGWDNGLGVPPTLGNLIFKNNITAYASATGLQTRPGGITIFNNLFVQNPIQITCCGWPSNITYNVFYEGSGMRRVVTDSAYGWGVFLNNWTCGTPYQGECVGFTQGSPTPGISGSTFSYNVMAHSISPPGNGNAVILGAATCAPGVGSFCIPATTGVTVTNNVICDWPTASGVPIQDLGSGNTVSSNTTNTAANCNGLGLPDPTRTIGDYYVSIGGPGGSTTVDFLNAAFSKWNKVDWDYRYLAPAVNNYLRAGFGIANP